MYENSLLIASQAHKKESQNYLKVEHVTTISTLSNFYQRQCLPRLRKFAESEGEQCDFVRWVRFVG